MDINDFLALVKGRRSCRRFQPGPPIPDEKINKIIEAARWAMSGANGQPWEFIVIRDQDVIKKISDITIAAAQEGYYCEQTRAAEFRQQIFAFGPPQRSGFEEASVIIAVVSDMRRLMASTMYYNFVRGEGVPGHAYFKNVANATQLLMFAAHASGLGSRWVSIGQMEEGPIKRLLEVPDVLDIHTLVPLGYADYEIASPGRRPLKELIHYEKYDKARYKTMQDIIKWLAQLRKPHTAIYSHLYKEK